MPSRGPALASGDHEHRERATERRAADDRSTSDGAPPPQRPAWAASPHRCRCSGIRSARHPAPRDGDGRSGELTGVRGSVDPGRAFQDALAHTDEVADAIAIADSEGHAEADAEAHSPTDAQADPEADAPAHALADAQAVAEPEPEPHPDVDRVDAEWIDSVAGDRRARPAGKLWARLARDRRHLRDRHLPRSRTPRPGRVLAAAPSSLRAIVRAGSRQCRRHRRPPRGPGPESARPQAFAVPFAGVVGL